MIVAFLIAVYVSYKSGFYIPVLMLGLSALFITIYDLISKKLPGMDIFVGFGVFFLVLYGATTVGGSLASVTTLAWIICLLGTIQVLFMQFIAGGLKDIENDYKMGAKTLAIKLGVRVTDGKLKISSCFKSLAYVIQTLDLIVVLLPFFIIWNVNKLLQYLQCIIIIIIAAMMFTISYKLLSMEKFERGKARKYIGSHYMTNFMIVPIMLMTLNPWAGILMFFPLLGFILNNLILHESLLQPKTM
jgi:hypothetical protein